MPKVMAAVVKDNVYTGEFEEIEVDTIDPNGQYVVEKPQFIDNRAIGGNKTDLQEIEIHGKVEGFVPAFDRVLIKRLPKPPDGLIARPEILQEQASRGVVIAVGESKNPMPPVGSIASFSKFAEEKHFDNEGADEYALVWSVDIRGWHV